MAHAARGRYDSAVAVFSAILETGDSPVIRDLRAAALAHLGRNEDALLDAEQAVRLDTLTARFRYNLGLIRAYGSRDRDASLQDLAASLELRGDSALRSHTLMSRALILMESGAYEAADMDLERLANEDDAAPRILLLRAICAYGANRPDAAAGYAARILENAHDTFLLCDARIILGNLRHKRGEWMEAKEFYRSALNENPRSSVAHHNLGVVCERIAHDDYRRYIRNRTKNANGKDDGDADAKSIMRTLEPDLEPLIPSLYRVP